MCMCENPPTTLFPFPVKGKQSSLICIPFVGVMQVGVFRVSEQQVTFRQNFNISKRHADREEGKWSEYSSATCVCTQGHRVDFSTEMPVLCEFRICSF